MQLSSSEVKGEWIEDTKKPEAKVIDTTSDDILVIEATVEGRARAISNDAVDVKVLALRNARSDDSNYQRYASSDFVEGDKFYLYFRTPVKGYVAAFLIDEQQQVFCLLPHANSSEGSLEVERNKDYVFFSANHDAAFSNSYEDGMRVTCADERLEMNRIYVIFSPNPFVKPIDYDGPPLGNNLFLPRQLSLKDFSRWMNKVYANDKKMSRQVVRIRIKK